MGVRFLLGSCLDLLLGGCELNEDFNTPVATAGLYCVIFGFTTYMFSLKMARLIIFMGPTSSILGAVAVGRVV